MTCHLEKGTRKFFVHGISTLCLGSLLQRRSKLHIPLEEKCKLLLAQDGCKMTPLRRAVLLNYTDALKCIFDCVPCGKRHELFALQHLEGKTILHYCSYICNSSDDTLKFLMEHILDISCLWYKIKKKYVWTSWKLWWLYKYTRICTWLS